MINNFPPMTPLAQRGSEPAARACRCAGHDLGAFLGALGGGTEDPSL